MLFIGTQFSNLYIAVEYTHTHTQAHTSTYAHGYAVGATAVHTLFSSYAHTIILLC